MWIVRYGLKGIIWMKVDIFLVPSNGESTSSSDLEGLSCGVCSTVFGVVAWKENKNRPQRRIGGAEGMFNIEWHSYKYNMH